MDVDKIADLSQLPASRRTTFSSALLSHKLPSFGYLSSKEVLKFSLKYLAVGAPLAVSPGQVLGKSHRRSRNAADIGRRGRRQREASSPIRRKGKKERRGRMGNQSSSPIDPSVEPDTLRERSVAAVADYIRDGGVKRVVVMTGAGISTAAGSKPIPAVGDL